MDNHDILRNHVLYQKSWTNWPCQHGLPTITFPSPRPKQSGTAPLTSDLPHSRHAPSHSAAPSPSNHANSDSRHSVSETVSLTSLSKSNNSVPKFRSKRVLSEYSKSGSNSLTSSKISWRSQGQLSERRDKRANRSRPWTEDVPKIDSNKDTYVEIHYEKTLPKGKWMEYKQRQYVTNPKYGRIYEVRTDTSEPTPRPPSPSTWLWGEEYRIWRLEQPREGETPPAIFSSGYGNNSSRKKKDKDKDKPHADLFAQYHAYRLDKQRRQHAATNIQRIVRGWVIRHKMKKMKRQALLGLSRGWPRFTEEYKETVTRIQGRYGVLKTFCSFDLDEVAEFIERREQYERVFDRMVDRRIEKLPRDDLPEFFRACGLHPTEGEINRAFNAIFRGSGNTADVIFVLDCSASLGPVNFRCQINFLKDIIQELDVAPDRIRVGFVPFNEDVFESFGLTRYKNKWEILQKIDGIKFKNGLTRTDLALKMMREMFQSARPGVQKICLVITDGKSHDVNLTLREARRAQQDNVDIYTIGVGYDIDTSELKCIATRDSNMYTVSDYKALVNLQDIIQKRICLGACTLCHHVLPRVQKAGFFMSEVMDMVWTTFPPLATRISRNIYNLVDPYNGSDQSPSARHQRVVRDACRPLLRDEALEILWTVYPPKASDIDSRKSRWIRPVIDETEAWSLLDDRILTETDFRTCLKLVIESRLAREGVIAIPSDLRAGIEEVSNAEEALEKIEKFLLERKRKQEEEKAHAQKKAEKKGHGESTLVASVSG